MMHRSITAPVTNPITRTHTGQLIQARGGSFLVRASGTLIVAEGCTLREVNDADNPFQAFDNVSTSVAPVQELNNVDIVRSNHTRNLQLKYKTAVIWNSRNP